MKIRSKCPHCKEGFEFELPFPDKKPDDEDDEPEISLSVGEISIHARKNNLQDCKIAIKELVKDKSIVKYLNSFEKKKFIKEHIPAYIE